MSHDATPTLCVERDENGGKPSVSWTTGVDTSKLDGKDWVCVRDNAFKNGQTVMYYRNVLEFYFGR